MTSRNPTSSTMTNTTPQPSSSTSSLLTTLPLTETPTQAPTTRTDSTTQTPSLSTETRAQTTVRPTGFSETSTPVRDNSTPSLTPTGSPATTQPFVVECPDVCPLVREQVCGTDGISYQSPCVLQLVACVRNDPTLMVASLGPCPSTTQAPWLAMFYCIDFNMCRRTLVATM